MQNAGIVFALPGATGLLAAVTAHAFGWAAVAGIALVVGIGLVARAPAPSTADAEKA